MLKFNEFMTEQFDEMIPVDSKFFDGNLENLNAELDALTDKPYQNAPIMLAQLRGVLERFGIQLPVSAQNNFLDLGAELVYLLGETEHHLYIVYDTNEDGFVDGYAQVVTSEELEDLLGMEADELLDSDRDPITMRPSTWYAKRDDDAGNSDEY